MTTVSEKAALDDRAADLLRGTLISQHAIIHTLVKKGVCTKEEYQETERWFADAFARLAAAAAIAAPTQGLSTEMADLFKEMQRKLFGE